MATALRPIEGKAAWYGRELQDRDDWIRRLTGAQRDEIAGALAAIRRAGLPFHAIRRQDFPLPKTAPLLAEISHELEDGRGVVRLRGLDVERYAPDELRQLFWGLGTHLGTALFQNADGEILGEVRDETRLAQPSFSTAAPGGIKTSRARTRSTGPLRFHTDLCDVIALLCVHNGAEGGISKLASSATVYNEILRRRPDLAALLLQDYWRARVRDSDNPNEAALYRLPVFGIRDGKFSSQYSRTFVELAQQNPAAPRLTAAQDEALDLLAEIAEEVCLTAPFEAGDIQLLNNHVVYHGRTAFSDDPAGAGARLLYRLWLSTPRSRALPQGFDVLWGDVAPGALRGGVVQSNTGQRAPAVLASAAYLITTSEHRG